MAQTLTVDQVRLCFAIYIPSIHKTVGFKPPCVEIIQKYFYLEFRNRIE